MTALKIMYFANILVAGWISISCLFFPKTAQLTVFSNQFDYSESIRLVGALWLAIFLISIIGLWLPYKMAGIFLFQLIYKSCWLLFAAVPAILANKPFPREMAVFFLIWVLILPFIIPWSQLIK